MPLRFQHDDVRMLDEIVCEATSSFPKPTSRSSPAPVRMLEEIVLDCKAPAVWLEIRLRPDGMHDAKTYANIAGELVEKIAAIDPSLDLVYDLKHSKMSGDEVVLNLVPGPVEMPAVRLAQILDRIRELLWPTHVMPLKVLIPQTANIVTGEPSSIAA